ncbi:Bifunctional adenosylcobalamin biosynthesis protein CobP [Methyloligella halotolerans]|uniref:Bifunctional adenosylcobalamin biosynthesis protein n=1 Tax=Methyloligella halotolerans TaxID=1177755 RepID=A0A1E2S1J5_9HYPH|nr:bifunctional adenosylcobinamide kinase/adenosylcobinamide-phosphate guanylyltransferase [Methyloligella halotolerans]ODA68270.1 Bifunctional adenosylcobalamin biosynthesis protein CobP [Methyloligella halotolerans]
MTRSSLPRLTLVLGGARSGKSRYAEDLLRQVPPPWRYVATAEARDEEMETRLEAHRARRGAEWRTVEAPLYLVAAIEEAGDAPLLIDCLTLWLTNAMLAERDLENETEALLGALGAARGPVIAVSNEVGLGIVPETPLGRRFRDAQGILNQRVAACADRVVLMTAGIPLTVKPQETGGRR